MSTMEQYLKLIGLESYQSLLCDNGYDDPELISELTEDDLVAIGIKKGHAKRAFLKTKEISTSSSSNYSSPDTSSSSNSTSAPGGSGNNNSNNNNNNNGKERSTTISIGKKSNDDEDGDSDDETPIRSAGPILQSRVLNEGFIQKRGNEGFFGSKMFKKRYFKIYEEGRLAYFKNQNDVSPISVVEMKGALAVEDTDKPQGFKLSMKTSARVYWLVAATADQKSKWVSVMKSMITPPVVPKPIDPNEIRPYLQHTEEPSQCSSTRFDSPLSWDAIEKQVMDGQLRLHIHSNGNLYVEETRAITVGEEGLVWIEDLPKKIDERTVHYQSYTDPQSFVAEQTYHNDDKTPEAMLSKLIGKDIQVSVPRDDHFDDPVQLKGTLIYNAFDKTYALQDKETNTVHFLKIGEAISYQLLGDAKLEPVFRNSSLEWNINGANQPDQLVKISYNAKDLFKWNANYVAVLNPRENEMEIRGWFTIENKSGKTFKNSNVILVREPETKKKDSDESGEDASPLPVALPKLGFGGFGLPKLPKLGSLVGGSSAPEPEKRIYRYEIPHATTLRDNEDKQICFVSTRLPVKSFDFVTFDTPKYTKYAQTGKDIGAKATASVNSSVTFTWNLPYSIPAGQMKLQRQLKDKFGSDIVNCFDIAHFNTSDIIELPLQPLGKVSSSRVQTGFNFDLNGLYIVETFEIRVNNGREEPVRITVEESLYRWNYFEITSSSHKFIPHATHSRKIQWVLNIPPLDGEIIKYSIFYSGLGLPESMTKKKD